MIRCCLTHWFTSMSSLSDHQLHWKSRGFLGHVLASFACLPGGVGLRGGAPAPSPACPETSRTNSAAYRQSGEWAISICSRLPDCFPVTTTSSTKRSYQFTRAAGVGVSSPGAGIFCTGIDGSVASSVCGAGRWASSNPSAMVDYV